MFLNDANKKTNQSPLYLQTSFSPALLTTLGTEQLISHMRTAIVDTFTYLQGSEREVVLPLVTYTIKFDQ